MHFDEDLVATKAHWDEDQEDDVLDDWESSVVTHKTALKKLTKLPKTVQQSTPNSIDPITLSIREENAKELTKFREAQALFGISDFSIEKLLNNISTVEDCEKAAFLISGTLMSSMHENVNYYSFVEKLADNICNKLSHELVRNMSTRLTDLIKKKNYSLKNKKVLKTIVKQVDPFDVEAGSTATHSQKDESENSDGDDFM